MHDLTRRVQPLSASERSNLTGISNEVVGLRLYRFVVCEFNCFGGEPVCDESGRTMSKARSRSGVA